MIRPTTTRLLFLVVLTLLCFGATASAQWRSLGGPFGGTMLRVATEGPLALATDGRGVFRSTDHGRTWAPYGLEEYEIVAVHVRNSVFYATSYESVYARPIGGAWFETKLQHVPTEIHSNVGAVFAMTVGNFGAAPMMSRSVDSGRTWQTVGTLAPYIRSIRAAAMLPTMLVVSGGSDAGSFVLRSTDDGESWVPRDLGDHQNLPTTLTVTGSTLVGLTSTSVVTSTDPASDWTECTACFDGMAFVPTTSLEAVDGDVYARQYDGVTRRMGAAPDQWSLVPSIDPSLQIQDLAWADNRLLAASARNGILVSTDRAASWQPSSAGIIRSDVRSMAHHGGQLFVGTAHGLFGTGNYGGEWHGAGLYDTVFALAPLDGVLLAGVADSGVYRTTDAGATWQRTSGLVGNVASNGISVYALHVVGGRILAGSDNGIFASTDRGATWAPVDTGVVWIAEPVRAFATVGARTFAASAGWSMNGPYGGVRVSEDGGASFRRTTRAYTWPAISIGGSGDLLLVGHWREDAPLSVSTDGGDTWATAWLGDYSHSLVRAIVVQPDEILLGTDAGVLRATTPSGPYRSYNQGLDTSVAARVLQVDGTGLLVGTAGRGAWRRTDATTGIDDAGDDDLADVVVSSGRLVVRLGADAGAIRLVDALGRTLDAADGRSGTATFDVSALPRGALFVVIEQQGRQRAVPVMIER